MNAPQEATRDPRPNIEQELSDLDGDMPRRRAHGALVAFRELQGRTVHPTSDTTDQARVTYAWACATLAAHARTIMEAYPDGSAGRVRWCKVRDCWFWAGQAFQLQMQQVQARDAWLVARKTLDIGSPEWLYSIHGDDIGNGAGG